MNTSQQVNNHRQDADTLRAEILRTREELGQTLQVLVERADVKSRVTHSVQRTARKPAPWFALAAGATAVVVALWLARGGFPRRRRRSRW